MESCLSKNIYVYYGSEHFNRDLLKKDNNKDIPKFSLVGLSLKSENGWKKWRNDNNVNSISKKDYFCFRINNNNLALENIDDIKKLPHYTNKGRVIIDYEALLKMDYPIYALHMRSKVAKYLLGIEYDCVLVLNDIYLIENYSAKDTDNPIIFDDICPLKYYKKIFNNIHVSSSRNKLDNKYYAYIEESDSYYGFKSLIVCLLDGKIIENRGYSDIEYKIILRKIIELDIK
ncbi:hypothetical protein A4V01_00115 [Erysipelotrichaceae bacterium I46]|uniref:hypothetical protein n=1 Tax=Clostridium innocuum TaxID=1522 RepID=UPI00080C8611|nr:hypothetical protein [[Clostridium] innocuum]ANU67457.1 hypothetical protein A4V01_00115 [Erysipelotrichaceae bacterium I46]ASU20118.1 hypothetical protein ADH65_17255 [[Clostridium] innocuum]QQR24735.1 hypothetical protein I5Q87_12460 [[Clostridium] innocuum]